MSIEIPFFKNIGRLLISNITIPTTFEIIADSPASPIIRKIPIIVNTKAPPLSPGPKENINTNSLLRI